MKLVSDRALGSRELALKLGPSLALSDRLISYLDTFALLIDVESKPGVWALCNSERAVLFATIGGTEECQRLALEYLDGGRVMEHFGDDSEVMLEVLAQRATLQHWSAKKVMLVANELVGEGKLEALALEKVLERAIEICRVRERMLADKGQRELMRVFF